MLCNIVFLLLLIIVLLLIVKDNKLFVLCLFLLIIFGILFKNVIFKNKENFSLLDIYYPSSDTQTINKDNMLNIFKEKKT